MPVTATQFLAPTSPDGVAVVVEASGYFIAIREDLPSGTGIQREWSSFDPGAGTARQFKGLGSSGSSSVVQSAWEYGGYAWTVQQGVLRRMNPATGGVQSTTLTHGLISFSNYATLVGSTAYVLYANGYFMSVNMATETSSLITSSIGVGNADKLFRASDGNFYCTSNADVYRVTSGGTATLMATAPVAFLNSWANFVELSGCLYATTSSGWAKIDMSTWDVEIITNTSLGRQIREVGGKLYSINSNASSIFGLDPSTGLQQSQSLTSLGITSSGPPFLFQRSTGQLWVVTDQPPTYP